MSRLPGIALVAFDFYGTLVRNDAAQWVQTLEEIAREQGLPVSPSQFWDTWRSYEIRFRMTRTNMQAPEASPPFRTYWEAWRDAFVETFRALAVHGDADRAADRCVEDLGKRDPFPDVVPALRQLRERLPLAVLSNADDRSLLGAIHRNGWRFEHVVSSEQARAYKPDPRAFLALCDVARLAPGQVLYVGDSAYDDAHGAKLVGMRTVLIRRDQQTPGRTPPPEASTLLPPDHVVESLEELVPLLE